MLQTYISTFTHITAHNLTSHMVLYFNSYHLTPQSEHSCSTSSNDYFKVTCCHTYRPQQIEHVRENMLRIIHRNARQSSHIRTQFVSSQDYQTCQPTTEEGNLSGPIRTGHNQQTHTDNTRQPEPQLKGSSCSSAIPSHNSRDAIPSHNSRNTTCLPLSRATTQGIRSEPQLKELQQSHL